MITVLEQACSEDRLIALTEERTALGDGGSVVLCRKELIVQGGLAESEQTPE